MMSGLAKMRWVVKKAGRMGVALASWSSGLMALRRWIEPGPRVRVLMYHRFRYAPYDPFSVSPESFERQIAWLSARGLAISLADFEAFLAGDKEVADGSVLVTVDDGYHDLLSRAAPVLQRYSVPAVAFISSGEVEAEAGADDGDERHLSWSEVCELPRHGVDIGSHARDHQSLGAMSRNQVYMQAESSRRELEAHLQAPVRSFAYPFGTRADYNGVVEEIVGNAGYHYAFTAQHGAVRPGEMLYALPRVKVEGGEGLWMFKLIVRGGLDAWGWIDHTFWWTQRNRN